jgi:hypothetical protein
VIFREMTMDRLESEALTALAVLLKSAIRRKRSGAAAGGDEGTVGYHRRRDAAGAVEGRTAQVGKVEVAEAIAHWRSQQSGGQVNLAALHDWLKREHDYAGSLKSVPRYWNRSIRAQRRVETPMGAQAQVNWAEYPGMVIGGETVDLVALVVTLSWSRKRAVV